MFERNEGTTDRIVRLGLGAFLMGITLQPFAAGRRQPVLAALAGLTGAVLLFTAATGSCLIYQGLNVSTYRE